MDHSAQGSTDIKKALQETVKLDDGRQGYIFTELPPIGLLSRWHCHICGRTISSERSLLMHLTHPVHTSNLRASQHPAAHFKKFVTKSGGKKDAPAPEKSGWSNTDVVPGEPVPPGMEDSIETCHIQEAFDSYKGPLIGLEYIVELVNLVDKSEPRYICLLCEKRGDPRSVMVHVTSQNHFLKYICCFFRTAGNILNLTKVTAENKKGYNIAIRKVAAEIEKHYGRLKPTSAAAETFAQKKYEILRAIDEKEHFRETGTTTFAHLVTPEKLEQYNDEEEDEILKPITRPLEDLNPKSSLSVFESKSSQKPVESRPPPHSTSRDRASESSRDRPSESSRDRPSESSREKTREKPTQNGSKSTKAAEIVVIDDEDDKKSLSPISSAGSVGGRSRRRRSSRSRSLDRRRRDKSPRRRMRSRSHTRSPGSRNRSPGRRDFRRDSPLRRTDERLRDDRLREDRLREERLRDDRLREDRLREERLRDDRDRDRRRERDRRELSPLDRRGRDGERRREVDDRSRRRYDERDRSPYRSPRRELSHERKRSPRRRSLERRTSLEPKPKVVDKEKKWDTYRSELNKLEVEFEKKLKYFEERPEKHPLYNEEWKMFWNRRYKEVQQSGHDPNTFDFKPEWIVYWGRRMKELSDEGFKQRSEQLKRDMNISMDDIKGPSSDLVDISPASSSDGKEVTIEDIKNTWKGLTGTELSGPPSAAPRKRSPSPWEDPLQSTLPPPQILDQPRREVLRDVAPPVIHCLRMLSVLENQLGSLGPRVMELLSRALAIERTGKGRCMNLLQDPEMHIFFDTVKEKIRGHLMAGIVERHLVNASRATISAINKMLKNHPLSTTAMNVEEMFRPATATFSKPNISTPVSVPGIGMIDKFAVAQQIATALVAQGRTDVSQEELEGLINAVVGIAQASNASVTSNTSSVSFFSQLNMKNSTADSRINDILSTMIKEVTGNDVNPNKQATEAGDQEEQKVDAAEEELKEKLSRFNSLSREDQQALIALLKELEKTDPKKVENLRKYVSVGLTKSKDELDSEAKLERNDSPALKEGAKKAPQSSAIVIKSDEEDDDDDDYTFEDVYNAASEKLKTEKSKGGVSQVSMDMNTDSNMSSATIAASEVPKSVDISNVFGPQRNPNETPSVAGAPSLIKFNPKNSAPEVVDPNSHMSGANLAGRVSVPEPPRGSGLGTLGSYAMPDLASSRDVPSADPAAKYGFSSGGNFDSSMFQRNDPAYGSGSADTGGVDRFRGPMGGPERYDDVRMRGYPDSRPYDNYGPASRSGGPPNFGNSFNDFSGPPVGGYPNESQSGFGGNNNYPPNANYGRGDGSNYFPDSNRFFSRSNY